MTAATMSRVLSLFALLFASSTGTDCTLACRNGGECKLGTAEYTYDSEADMGLHFNKQMGEQFCKCPTGWIGMACEIKYAMCPANQKTCSNGAPCEKANDDNGETFLHCECDATLSDLSSTAANHLCEHASTVYCSAADPVTGQALKHSFCYNGGRCNAMITSSDQAHQGCDCGVYWEGPHCQFYRKKNEQLSQTSKSSKKSTAMLSVGFAVAVIVLVIAGACYCKRHSGKQRNDQSRKNLRDFDEALGDSGRSFRHGENGGDGDFQSQASKFGGEVI